MRKRNFDKILNSYIDKNSVCHYMIEDFYKDNNKDLFNNGKASRFIQENFDVILKNAMMGNLSNIIEEVIKHENMIKFVQEHLFDILVYLDEPDLNKLKHIKELNMVEILNNNVNKLFEYNIKMNIMISIYSFLDKKDYVTKLFNNYYSSHKDEFVKAFFKGENTDEQYGKVNDENYKYVYTVLTMLLDELIEDQNLLYTDVTKIARGAYSAVIGVGDKVIKYGRKRKTYNIPNDKRLLNPLLRIDLSTMGDNLQGTIEIMEKVDTKTRFTLEQLYSIYKDIRSRGIICADIKADNIGVLLHPNKPRFNKEIADIPSVKGFDKEAEILQAGEIVIIDSDFIYREGDSNIRWGNNTTKGFEERYLKEMNNNPEEELSEKSCGRKL